MVMARWVKRTAATLCAVLTFGLVGAAAASAAPGEYRQASTTVTWYSIVHIRIYSLTVVAPYVVTGGRITDWGTVMAIPSTYFIFWDWSNKKAWWDYRTSTVGYAYGEATFKHYVGIGGVGIPIESYDRVVSVVVRP